MKVADMRVIGRNSAGVKLFDVAKGETVVGAARIDEGEDSDEDEAEGEEGANAEPAAEAPEPSGD